MFASTRENRRRAAPDEELLLTLSNATSDGGANGLEGDLLEVRPVDVKARPHRFVWGNCAPSHREAFSSTCNGIGSKYTP